MSDKKSQGPLLYVFQPFSRTPSNKNMQEVYTNRGKGDQPPPQEEKPMESVTRKKIPFVKKETFEENEPVAEIKPEAELETIEPPLSTPVKQIPRPSFNRVKPFKELSIPERLDYLHNFPKVLPPVPCVFYTKDTNHQGYLTAYDREEVTIRFHDGTTITFPIEELKDILMIGIKR
jgi:hypothetical protein